MGNFMDCCPLKKIIAIIFGSKPYISRIYSAGCSSIVVKGAPIQFVKVVKNLGVIMDSTLTWQNHIDKVISRLIQLYLL